MRFLAEFLVAILIFSSGCLCDAGATDIGGGFHLRPDGSIAGHFPCAGPDPSSVFSFGFPTNNAAKVWSEGKVLRRQWLTNGIRYTQTILRTSYGIDGSGRKREVLLVNIQGENTNSEYSLAQAALQAETARKCLHLQFKNGIIWRLDGDKPVLMGALEIPEPGVRTASGPTLRFEGNMPPSEKGSMTLKLPLEHPGESEMADHLAEIDFAEEVRAAVRSQK